MISVETKQYIEHNLSPFKMPLYPMTQGINIFITILCYHMFTVSSIAYTDRLSFYTVLKALGEKKRPTPSKKEL